MDIRLLQKYKAAALSERLLYRSQKVQPLCVRYDFIYLFLILSHVICYAAFDPVYRIQKMADRRIMIQRINDQSNIFAHIAADVVWLCKKLRRLINQVSSKELVKVLLLVSIVKFLKTIGKESEGRAD